MWDLVRSTLVPLPPEIRAMGFAREIAGIQGRFERCGRDWAPHLAKSRETILRGAARAEARRRAIILGGGLQHDVPLDELAAIFREVILVDVVHPLAHRWATKRFKNVTHLRADVTGTLRDTYHVAWDAHLPLPRREPTLFLDDPEVDFTASVNLLSQLPCMPMAYLNAQGVHPPEKVDEYARDLIASHLRYLERLPGRVTLVTDIERLKLTRSGEIVERRDLFFGVPWPTRGEEWEWRLAPWPEADRKHHYFRRVRGIADFK